MHHKPGLKSTEIFETDWAGLRFQSANADWQSIGIENLVSNQKARLKSTEIFETDWAGLRFQSAKRGLAIDWDWKSGFESKGKIEIHSKSSKWIERDWDFNQRNRLAIDWDWKSGFESKRAIEIHSKSSKWIERDWDFNQRSRLAIDWDWKSGFESKGKIEIHWNLRNGLSGIEISISETDWQSIGIENLVSNQKRKIEIHWNLRNGLSGIEISISETWIGNRLGLKI